MNKQRIKSIGILVAVLVTGVLLGILVPGAFHHMRGRGHSKMDQRKGDDRRGREGSDWFVDRIKKVVNADSTQEQGIDSVAHWANERLNNIERQANEQSMLVLDSAVSRLTPILREDQQKSLQQFREQIATKAKTHRGRH
jgi:hypothetical protein